MNKRKPFKRNEEHVLQCAMVRHCRTVLRLTVRDRFAAFPNETGFSGKKAEIIGAKRNREGRRAGMPDLIFWRDNGRTLWVEVKTPAGKLSKEQREIHSQLSEDNHQVCVVRSVAELHEILVAFYTA